MKLLKKLAVCAALLSLLPVFSFAQVADTNPNGLSCAIISKNLAYGMRDTNDSDVSILQDFLHDKGFLSSLPTGFFGRQTLNAVFLFQRANGISPTGYVGSLTRARIQVIDCTQTTPQTPSNLPPGCTSTFGYSPITGIKCDSGTSNPSPNPDPNTSLNVVALAVSKLAAKLNVSPTSVSLVNIEKVTWPNGCLGIDYGTGSVCTQSLVNGYKIILNSGGQTYEYHTNSNGSQIVESINNVTNNVSFSATPQTGISPLSVNFITSGIPYTASSPYSIDFGDGTSGTSWGIGFENGSMLNMLHTYTSAGTYTAKLLKNTCPAGAQCFAGPQTVGTVIVTVTSGNQNQSINLTASPQTGVAPLSVSFGANGLTSGTNYSIDFGDGTQSPLSIIAQADCSSCNPNTYGAFHTYTTSGVFTAKLMYQPPYTCPQGQYCTLMMPAPQIIKTVTVTATGNTQTGSLSVTPASGSAPLTITISAPSSVENKINSCVYSQGFFGASGNGLRVDWGDGTVSPTNASSRLGQSCTNEITTHTYAQSGTYTVRVTSWHPGPTDAPITDWQGSAIVTVSGSASASEIFTATPASGNVPLNVSYRIDNANTLLYSYSISYGDGTSPYLLFAPAGAGNCTGAGNGCFMIDSHIYSQAGTYTATLYRTIIASCSGGVVCSAGVREIVKSAIVTAGSVSSNGASLSAYPTTGNAPLSVAFSATRLPQSNSLYTIQFGDGTTQNVQGNYSQACTASYPITCTNFYGFNVSHVYTTAGAYTAQVISNNSVVASTVITVTGVQSSGGSLAATPASGSSPLTVSFSGNTNSGCDGGYFTMYFGDGSSEQFAIAADSCRPTVQTGHVYYAPGTYSVTLANTYSNATIANTTVSVR
jgi:PKD repeat protein